MHKPSAISQILVIRWMYFFYYAAFGIFITYMNVYLRSIGLSGSEIGLVNTLSPLMGLAGGPLWGGLSDRFRNPRLFLGVAVTGTVIALLAFSSAAAVPAISVTVAVYSLFAAAFPPLIDSLNLAALGENRDRYGQQRVWGSIGYMIGAFVFGYILRQSGLHGFFYGSIACIGMVIPGLVLLNVPHPAVQRAPWSGFTSFLRQPGWLLFTTSLILIGITNNALNNFLGIYIRDQGGSEVLIGGAVALGVLAELPIMYFSPFLLRRYGSRALIATGFFFFAVRMVLYSLIPSAEWTLPLALLHGVTYTPFWVGSVTYASELAPDNLKSTVQGLLMATTQLAGVIAGPLNGALYDTLGAGRLFQVSSLLAILALVFLWANYKKTSPLKSG